MLPSLPFLPVFALFVAGAAAAQKLKVDVPVAELEARATRDSNDAVAHYNLALGYWSEKQWDRVQERLDRAIGLDPRFAPATLALAYLPFASGQGGKIEVRSGGPGIRIIWFVPTADSVLERFDRYYRLAFMLDPLVDVRIAVTAEYRGGVEDHYDRALYAYNDGKWEEAYQRFGRLLEDSGDGRGWHGRQFERVLRYHALAATRLNKHDDALRDLDRLVARSLRREASDTTHRVPLRTNEYRYLLAFVKQRAGDPNGAVATYQDALGNDIGLFPAHTRIADVYEGARMWDQAILARRNAINANPDDPGLQLDLGWTLAKAGRFVDAEEALRDAAQRAPREARAAYYLGIVQQQLSKGAEARATFERFVQIAPSRYERQVNDARQRLAALR